MSIFSDTILLFTEFKVLSRNIFIKKYIYKKITAKKEISSREHLARYNMVICPSSMSILVFAKVAINNSDAELGFYVLRKSREITAEVYFPFARLWLFLS